jgi:hypothetical protein
MNNDYLWDRTGEPDAEVQQLEEVLGTLRYQPEPFQLPAAVQAAPRRRFFSALAIAAALAFMILAGGIWLSLHRQQASAPDNIVKTPKERESRQPVNTSSPESTVERVRTLDKNPDELAAQRKPAPRRNRAPRHADRNDSPLLRDEMTAAQRAEAEAAKVQLMLALRVVSAKLNLAQRKIPTTNIIRNQHKLG